MIKLIVSDLDGTLLDIPNGISDINLKAIEYAHDKGAQFYFATGRDIASVRDIKKLLKHEPYLLLGNGAQFFDNKGNLIAEEYFPNKYLKEVTDILNKHDVSHMIFAKDGFYTTTEPEAVRQRFIERIETAIKPEFARVFREDKSKPSNNLVRITDMDEFINTKNVIKVEGFDMNSEPIEAVKHELERYTELSHMSTGKNNVEVTSISAQKGIALKKQVERMGLSPDEVMVMGDSNNDISMFECFKYSFAPDNSCDAIKKLAHKVVVSCVNHGVSEAIYEMIK